MNMRIVTECATCDNDISVPFVQNERSSATMKRLADHVASRHWQPLFIGRKQVGFCCAACCKNFGIEEEQHADTAENVVSIR